MVLNQSVTVVMVSEEEEWDRSSHLEPWIRSIFHGLRILYRNAMRRIINSEHHRSSHARSSLVSDRESGNEQGCRTWQGYEPSKDANSDRSSSLTGLINTSPLLYSNWKLSRNYSMLCRFFHRTTTRRMRH